MNKSENAINTLKPLPILFMFEMKRTNILNSSKKLIELIKPHATIDFIIK
jgi:hypothetical protein